MIPSILAFLAAAGLEGCGTTDFHGTKVKWHESVERAAETAGREGRLLLVLHVSGHFPDPGLT